MRLQGVGLAAIAAMSPSLLLPSSIATSPLAATMLGCTGVALVRVGSIMWFLRVSAQSIAQVPDLSCGGSSHVFRHNLMSAMHATQSAFISVFQDGLGPIGSSKIGNP